MNVIIVDYGTGNVSSVKRGIERAGFACRISADARDVEESDKIILAGVGHFATGMAGLRKGGLLESLEKAVLIHRKPVLGICLGMELMARSSEEAAVSGLGWLAADAIRFRISDKLKYKVPHMGWNTVSKKKDGVLMRGVDAAAEFYFNHSYYLRLADSSNLSSETDYETRFTASIEKDNIFGVQFHPEKSRGNGMLLLKNFLEL